MQCFKNILVGVDLTKCRQYNVAELTPSAKEAIDCAIWLAHVNSAELLFFAALTISPEALEQVRELANKLLGELVDQAAKEGVTAQSRLVQGQPVQEIMQQVKREGHDLVVTGIRDQTWLSRMIFGNTSLTLLHHCPCPVWVAKPGHTRQAKNILIATDLKAAGAEAMRLGVPLGQILGSTVHVLHLVEYPLDFLWGPAPSEKHTQDYHARIRSAAEETLKEQFKAADPQGRCSEVQFHIGEGLGAPDAAIEKFLREHPVDVLVKGTVVRTGVESLMRGHTAARLLPEVHCSILAVRPGSA